MSLSNKQLVLLDTLAYFSALLIQFFYQLQQFSFSSNLYCHPVYSNPPRMASFVLPRSSAIGLHRTQCHRIPISIARNTRSNAPSVHPPICRYPRSGRARCIWIKAYVMRSITASAPKDTNKDRTVDISKPNSSSRQETSSRPGMGMPTARSMPY